MNYFRAFLKALHDERVRAHRLWLRRNKVVLPLPKPDSRAWSDEYMRSLRHG